MARASVAHTLSHKYSTLYAMNENKLSKYQRILKGTLKLFPWFQDYLNVLGRYKDSGSKRCRCDKIKFAHGSIKI